jgi:endoglucanase
MEREIPTIMTGTINQTYHAGLVSTVNYITGKGAYALIDPHNFGRYYGNVITDYAGFKSWWTTVATEFKGNSKVIFDCNNEPHDMGSASVPQLMQACIGKSQFSRW